MRITSPPKYHNEHRRSLLGVSSQNLSLRYSSDQPQQQLHLQAVHLRSPSSISPRSPLVNSNNIQLPLPSPSDKRENLYNELRNREREYVGLIKNLHQENNHLKQEIVKLRKEEEGVKIGCKGGKMVAQDGGRNHVLVQNQQVINKTFSNFAPKGIQLNNNYQKQQQHQQQVKLIPFYKPQSPNFPLLMSRTSPEGFKSPIRTKSPCIRPVIRNHPPIHPSNNCTSFNSNQPSFLSYKPSINESCLKSPRSLEIVNVLNTAISTPNISNISRNIAFEQTDDTKENHLNPTGSKMSRLAKSGKTEDDGEHVQDTSDMKVAHESLLLSKLKHKLQQQTPSFQPHSSTNPPQQLQQSQCLTYIKPSLYNSNIRFSDNNNDDDTNHNNLNLTNGFIHPIERNILTGFPILSKLRLAQSEFEKDNNQEIKQHQQQQQEKVNKSVKNSLSFNVIKSEGSKQSRLSQKISKENQNQATSSRNYQAKPLTIIKMLDQTITNQNQGQMAKNSSNVIPHASKQCGIREQSQLSQHSSLKIISQNPNQILASYDSPINLVSLQKQYPTQKVSVVNVDNEVDIGVQQSEETFEIEQPLPNGMQRLRGVEQNSHQQEQLIKPNNFNNRMYYDDTQRDSIVQGNQYETGGEVVGEENEIKSVREIGKRVRINQMKSKTTFLTPSTQQISHSQYIEKLQQHQLQQQQLQQPQQQQLQQPQQQQLSQQVNKFQNVYNIERQDESIEEEVDKFSFKKQSQKIINQSQPNPHLDFTINKENPKLDSSYLTSQLNKTSPATFSTDNKIASSINKRYLQNNFSLSSNQWKQISKSVKSHKMKRISNQAYL